MKRGFTFIIFILSVLTAMAQNTVGISPGELLLAIRKSKPDTNRISLQLKLGNYYHSKPLSKPVKPDDYKHNQDSAINLFSQALRLSIKLNETDRQYNALDMIAECEGEKAPEHSKQILLRAVAYYHQKGNLGKEAHARERLAGVYFKNDKFNDNVLGRIGHYQHARSLYLQNHEPAKAAGILTDIAANRITVKQFDLAEKELQQSLAEYKALGYKKLQYTYMTLVDLEYTKGNNYRAMAYCLQGIKSTGAGENISYTSYFYWNAARCNYSGKKFREALDWLRKAIDIDSGYPDYKYFLIETLLELNRTEEALATINNIGKGKFPHTAWDTLNLYRGFALYYAKKNNTNLAVRYYLKSLEMAGKVFGEGGYSWRIICYNGIVEAYLKANQAAKAEKYINDCALIFKKAKTTMDPALLVDFYTNSYKYDPATGNYRAAFKNAKTPLDRGLLWFFYNNSYKFDLATRNYQAAVQKLAQSDRLKDSLSTVDKENKIAELEIQYQTAQKEQSIKDLHSQGAVQRSELEKANLQRNVTIGGIGIMIVVSGLFYKNYRQKKSANNIINHKNKLLQHLLTEKEWLLKEVHHRVKNNLHTVICLLESQAAYLKNDALKAIENSRNRIYAMSLIHQKLYQSDDIKTIDMSTYIPELVKSLGDSFDVSNQIQFKLKIDPVNLDISHAIPLGLIINEAVTNSIKYAFPNNRKGEISISMVDHEDRVKLDLADNGIGMLQIDCEAGAGSLGLELMKGLSEDINADITFKIDNGTRIIIIFKSDELNNTESFLKSAKTKETYV
jgi:two-component sensor histidine kinase